MFGKLFNRNKYKTQSEVTVLLAKKFISYMKNFSEPWDNAYFRFHFSDNDYGCNGSFSSNGNASIFDVFEHETLFDSLQEIALQLHEAILNADNSANFRVALLTINSAYEYDIKYEYEDINKWEITKTKSNGIPVGLQ